MIRFGYAGRRYPRYRFQRSTFFKWNSYGKPLPPHQTHRPTYPNWLVYAPLYRNNVWVWSRGLKSGGPPPPPSAKNNWTRKLVHVNRLMGR